MVMSDIDGIEIFPRSGNLVVSSCVYADLNWSFSISALLLLSLCIIPLLALKGATPELSCFFDFINEQKRLGLVVCSGLRIVFI